MIAVADVEKPSSLEVIRQFEKLGIDVVMLTGDNEKTAAAIGKRLHIEHVIAQVLPHQKEEKIRELMENGHKVAMIKDGINNAPALARANVGIAIGAETDVAIESADAMNLSSVCVLCNALRLRFFKPLKAETPAPAADTKETGKNEAQNVLPNTSAKIMIMADENLTSKTNLSEKREQALKELTLTIEGMMCMHCQKHTTDALNAIEGVTAEVNLEEKKAYIKADREIADDVLKKAVADAGYEVTEIVHN